MYILNKTRIVAVLSLALSVSSISAMKGNGTVIKTVWCATAGKPAIARRGIADGSPDSVIAHLSLARSCERGLYAGVQAVSNKYPNLSGKLGSWAARQQSDLHEREALGELSEQKRYGLDLWKAMNPGRVQYLAAHLRKEGDDVDVEASDESTRK